GADAVLEVSVTRVFPNCPRYVHNLSSGEVSEFAPAPGHTPPEAEWKSTKDFTDVLPKNN
ncbi:MAG: pyridoxamine 5'-phosphate oxidase family protein, partial [Acidimicrobiales bacterium]